LDSLIYLEKLQKNVKLLKKVILQISFYCDQQVFYTLCTEEINKFSIAALLSCHYLIFCSIISGKLRLLHTFDQILSAEAKEVAEKDSRGANYTVLLTDELYRLPSRFRSKHRRDDIAR